MDTNKPNTCTGCGATVTKGAGVLWRDEWSWRDVTGSAHCQKSGFSQRHDVAEDDSVSLPPVAIAEEKFKCTSCEADIIRGVGDSWSWRDVDGSAYCKPGSPERHTTAPVAIKPEAGLTPLEQEMLAALRAVLSVAFSEPHVYHSSGCTLSRYQPTACNKPCALWMTRAAIAKAEAVQA